VSPKTSLRTRVSAASPAGVDVPCALMYPTSAGSRPASVRAIRTARAACASTGSGSETWFASEETPLTGDFRIDAGVARAGVLEGPRARERRRLPR
jgi:hypothetical protein